MRKKAVLPLALLALAILVGVAAGLGAFTFVYANGASYLTDDPKACANCHVMNEQYDGWTKSSHRSVAVCNDCHTAQGLVGKYWTKMSNGYHHSLAFTTGKFVDPIAIKAHNLAVTEARCRGCHAPIVAQIDTHGGADGNAISCVRCHRNVGHLH